MGARGLRSVSRSRAGEGEGARVGPGCATRTPAASAARAGYRAVGKISSARAIGRRDGGVVSARLTGATTKLSWRVIRDAKIGDASATSRASPSPGRSASYSRLALVNSCATGDVERRGDRRGMAAGAVGAGGTAVAVAG